MRKVNREDCEDDHPAVKHVEVHLRVDDAPLPPVRELDDAVHGPMRTSASATFCGMRMGVHAPDEKHGGGERERTEHEFDARSKDAAAVHTLRVCPPR